MTVTLRVCTADDAATLALIGSATLLEAFAGVVPGDSLLAHSRKHHVPEAYVEYLARPETRAWLAEVEPGAAPVGYAILTAPVFPADLVQVGDLELRRVYVFSKFHGAGVGKDLMERAIAAAREQGAGRLLLGVHPYNHRALAFYRKTGFVQVGTRVFQVGASTFEDPVLALTL
jgi:ribosomal protein S18 acetylase RimI-like enzyme